MKKPYRDIALARKRLAKRILGVPVRTPKIIKSTKGEGYVADFSRHSLVLKPFNLSPTVIVNYSDFRNFNHLADSIFRALKVDLNELKIT